MGGGAQKVLPCLEGGGGAQKVLGPQFSYFLAPPPPHTHTKKSGRVMASPDDNKVRPDEDVGGGP